MTYCEFLKDNGFRRANRICTKHFSGNMHHVMSDQYEYHPEDEFEVWSKTNWYVYVHQESHNEISCVVSQWDTSDWFLWNSCMWLPNIDGDWAKPLKEMNTKGHCERE